MSLPKGYIDRFENGIIIGWVLAEDSSNIQLFFGEKFLGSVTDLIFRQDVANAGITYANTGFTFDATDFFKKISGSNVLSIKVDGQTVTEKEVNSPTGVNFVLNPFLEIEDRFSLRDIELHSSFMTAMHINRFIAPDNLEYSNGSYTRISLDDNSDTQSDVILNLSLDTDLIVNSQHLFELVFVVKGSNVFNVHVCWLDENNKCIYDEPIQIDSEWSVKKLLLNQDLSYKIRSGSLNLQLVTKHYGRKHIDISMVVLTEDFSKFVAPKQKFTTQDEFYESIHYSNLFNNGELDKWSKGIDFSKLKRGQELADNWFIEMSKENADQGNVQLAVTIDDVRSKQDLTSDKELLKYGLHAHTQELSRYARLVCPLNISSLEELDYKLSIDIEANTPSKKTTLPMLYFIPRSAVEEKPVIEIARKVKVVGRQTLNFDLTSYQMNDLLNRSDGMPVLALAIELPSQSDISIYGISLKVIRLEEKIDSQNQLKHIDYIDDEGKLFFEDNTIVEQLHLLKGLESWLTGDRVTFPIRNIDDDQTTYSTYNNNFDNYIQSLTPHKMLRPARNFPFIDIIVPVYNACDDVLLCLSSLIEKTDLVHRVVVVNDGEDERTADMLNAFESSFNHLEVLNNPVNLGYTKSVNKGIKHSNAEWVVVLNSDTIVSEGWLGRMMNCALSSDKVGMVGPLSNAASWQSIPHIADKNGDWHLNPLPEGLSIDKFAEMVESYSTSSYPEVEVINGFCQLINMELLDEIGLLDEIAFPIGYGEENDMCARAVKAGYKLLIADDTYVFHAKSKSFGHEQRKKLAKQGSKALKEKHPDVDWGKITKSFRENEAINTLRDSLSSALKQYEHGEVN